MPSGLRKIFAEDGQRLSRASSLADISAMSSVTGMPSRASFSAGAIRSASVKRPEPYSPRREGETLDRARHADGERGIARFLRIGVALRIEKGFVRDRRRRGLAIVDRGIVAGRLVDQHEAAAAEIAGARIGHRERKADRDRGIHRIAALLQNVDADARRDRFLRHHHAVLGDDRLGMADLLVAPRRGRQRERADKRKAKRREGSNVDATLRGR